MMDLKGITLCAVDCSTHELAARALAISLSRCRFERALFLTDRQMALDGVEVRPIPTIASILDYSTFVLTRLVEYIETDFVLLIQWDGYILSADAWQREFLDYDYIGARWAHVPGAEVGNGGFSLRSRRLLEATADPGFVVGHPEDAAVCIVNRSRLRLAHALRFAPPALADRFSYERVNDGGPHFGFHGLFNMGDVLTADELPSFLAMLPPRVASSTEMLELVLRYYLAGWLPEAKLVWGRAVALSSEERMTAFLAQHIRPESLAPVLLAALKM